MRPSKGAFFQEYMYTAYINLYYVCIYIYTYVGPSLGTSPASKWIRYSSCCCCCCCCCGGGGGGGGDNDDDDHDHDDEDEDHDDHDFFFHWLCL